MRLVSHPPAPDGARILRVLLVDDDPILLRSLARLLRAYTEGVEVATAEDGREALQELRQTKFDVVVADIDMPGLTGPELLARIQRKRPDVVRIHLSGTQSLEARYAAVPVAHQFLAKPIGPDRVIGVVDSIRRLRALLTAPAVRAVVGRSDELPALPRVYAELTQTLAQRTCTYDDVAAVIERDSAVCAAVMKIASSPFFIPRTGISRVRDAVSALGLAHLRALMFQLGAIKEFMPASPKTRRWFEERQQHALLVAHLATAINEDDDADHVTMAAMLHDIGQLVLMHRMPDEYAAVLEEAQERSLVQVERERIGATHAEVGAYLLGLWGLPEPIVWAVARHHEAPGGSGLDETLQIANALAHETAAALAGGTPPAEARTGERIRGGGPWVDVVDGTVGLLNGASDAADLS